MYYPRCENKGADQLRGNQLRGYREADLPGLICVFILAYADCWFSHEAAKLYIVHVYVKYYIICTENILQIYIYGIKSSISFSYNNYFLNVKTKRIVLQKNIIVYT